MIHVQVIYNEVFNCSHGEAPDEEQTRRFIELCKHFFTLPDYYGRIIGVHCTHGYNRTGFLISAYLIEEEDWSLEQAVMAFSDVSMSLSCVFCEGFSV